MQKLTSFFLVFLSFAFVKAQNKTEAYIAKYSSIAIEEMHRYNIPASITLAQAIIESGNGESRLATEGNNHFGIKCHDNWNGETINEDDDKKGECFRKYLNDADSYRDHSLFLKERSRYSFLFKYKRNNYKRWAKGLKKAGYATNPRYPTLLIDLIEKYNLSRFDKESSEERSFYFARSYGLPYLIGLGVYYFNKESVYYTAVNTSFLFSEANMGCYYRVAGQFYVGANSGVIYLPTEKEDFIPQVSAKLMYKKNLILISGGIQFPLDQMEYKQIPFLELTYLLD